MPLPKLGLRLRVALALALACIVVIGALGFTLYKASEDLEQALVDQLMADEMDDLIDRHRDNPGFVPQPTANFQRYIVRGREDIERLPAELPGLGAGRHELTVGKEGVDVLVRDAKGGRYFVIYEMGLYEQRERNFQALLLLSIVTAVLASLALGYLLSGLLVSQVTDLARKVEQIGPGAETGGLARPDQDREVALLARALDDYHARIGQMVRREREFTSNASHELRTPLTAIQTSCELLLADNTLCENARVRVAMIGDAAGRMAEQLQVLLLLARGQALGEIEMVAIADCVAEVVEPYRGEIARKRLVFESDLPRDAVLEVNRPALRLILVNLVRNAVQFTDHGSVRISYAARRLTISDSGRGISAEHLQRVFERFFRTDGAGGSGVGLAIVKRICDHYGWNIEVESAPMKGSTFSITFP